MIVTPRSSGVGFMLSSFPLVVELLRELLRALVLVLSSRTYQQTLLESHRHVDGYEPNSVRD